ncbi:hypothetical protein ACO1O0_004354 [Amphichorda felina]
MNGHAHRPSADEYGLPPKTGIDPSGRVVAESYRKDIINGFEKEAPLYNPMNPERPQSSALVDLKDPIQIHLLTETALTDSKEYEILSQEEIDDLKKQSQLLVQRIESTKSNLLIQSKYRDAAISMTKLYSPTQAESKRKSLLGNRMSRDESVREAEMERDICERKCEELATELFHLEKRLMEPKRRLLEHTAGILQLTHKTSSRQTVGPNGQPLNGVPGSPESMYTYTQGRNSLDGPDDFYTDDTSFHGFDTLDGRGPRRNPLEIPTKSPIREQQSQLKEEMDRLREDNQQLMDSVAEMEQRLEGLNGSLRETIVRFNPEENSAFEGPPSGSRSQDMKPGDVLKRQVEYLETGLMAVQTEQESYMAGSRQDDSGGGGGGEEQELLMLWDLIQSGYTGIKQQKDDRRKARQEKGLEDDESDDDGIDLSETYSLYNFSSRVRWLYRQATMLKDQKSVLKRQIKQQRELNNKSDAEKDADLAQKQEDLDRAENEALETQKMLSDALEDLEKARDAAGASETVQAELEERTARTRVLEAKLQDLQEALREAESDSDDTQQRLAQVDASISALSGQLDNAIQSRDAAEERARELQNILEAREKELEEREKELEEAGELQDTLKAKEKELEDINVSYAELKTEVTIARAELDGAYGSRAERAADAAAVQNTNEIDRLRSELAETVKELEGITKETIASEREKVDLESKLDEALAARSELEADMGAMRQRLEDEVQRSRTHISKLQDELDGERLRAGRGSSDSARPGAGASMLSEQFRATMREERKKYQEEMREERARGRKLEEELARLKRAQGPGRSPLSPR